MIVFSMLMESTTPSRTLRAFSRTVAASAVTGVVSAIGGLQCFVSGDLALTQDGVQAGDLLADTADAGEVLLLAGGQLEAELEQLLLGVVEAAQEVVAAGVTPGGR